jgi:hypothetical protein
MNIKPFTACAAFGAYIVFGLATHAAEPTCGPTAHLRMPYAEWHAVKSAKLKEAGYTWEQGKAFQLDHIIPLCIGGSNDSTNLVLQPWYDARKKDRLERETCQAYCAGRISLHEAQARFRPELRSETRKTQ